MTFARMLLGAVLTTLVVAAPAGAGTVAWRSEQPAPPPGAPFSGPVGTPGDLRFAAPNLGLMMVWNEPGDLYRPGLLAYDGTTWRQISNVCGGQRGRIAIAGARDWWTTSATALQVGAQKSRLPITLCHFRDGVVVGSYAAAYDDVPGSYSVMTGAACTGPSDCWFGGETTDQPTIGTFLLHWDGASMTRVAHPSARAIGDLTAFGGAVVGGTVVGAARWQNTNPPPRAGSFAFAEVPETVDIAEQRTPRLLRTLRADGSVGVANWPGRTDATTPAPSPGFTRTVDLVALDGVGDRLWLAGRGSQSASDYTQPRDESNLLPFLRPVDQQPFLALQRAGDALPREVTWSASGPQLVTTDSILDVAGIPGTNQAWLALTEDVEAGDGEPNTESANASMARVEVDTVTGIATILERVDLTRPDVVIGDAAHLACPAVNDCWMVTARGWVYHLSDPDTRPAQNPDPILRRLITARPVDARTPRDDPDTVPADEASGYVAPPVEAPDPEVTAAEPKRIAALFRVVGKPRVRRRGGRYVIEVRISVRRRARVQLVGRRGGRVVARTKRRTLKRGTHVMRLQVTRKRWPTALRFVTTDLEIKQPTTSDDDIGGGSGDTITTG